jgi:hypothetical protein
MSGYETSGNQEERPGLPPYEMLADAVTSKFEAYPECVFYIDSSQPGQVFENLQLETIYLQRETLGHDRWGVPSIVYSSPKSSEDEATRKFRRIIFNNDGYWEYVISDEDTDSHYKTGDKVNPIRIVMFLVKVLKERPIKPDYQADNPAIWDNLDEL